jgi:hypothetical protein
MKRWFLFAVVTLMVFILSACASAQGITQGFVELPDGVKARITALVVAVVAFFFLKLVELVPALKFLEQFRLPLSLAVAAELISLIQNAVPDAYAAIAVLAIQLVLEIVALVLVFVKLKEMRVKGFR